MFIFANIDIFFPVAFHDAVAPISSFIQQYSFAVFQTFWKTPPEFITILPYISAITIRQTRFKISFVAVGSGCLAFATGFWATRAEWQGFGECDQGELSALGYR